MSLFEYYFYFPFVKNGGNETFKLFALQQKKGAENIGRKVNYKSYGRKHSESRFTKFYQDHYLPFKSVDKRRSHNSSYFIRRNYRNEALTDLNKPLYEPAQLREDKLYISEKLGISLDKFELYLSSQGRSYRDFPNWDRQPES